MSTITSTGMSVLAQDEWTAAEVGNDPQVVGLDPQRRVRDGLLRLRRHEAQALASRSSTRRPPGSNDGRFLQANFGNGVLGTFWSTNTMDDHVALVDVSSVDKYAYTSPHVRIAFPNPHWPWNGPQRWRLRLAAGPHGDLLTSRLEAELGVRRDRHALPD